MTTKGKKCLQRNQQRATIILLVCLVPLSTVFAARKAKLTDIAKALQNKLETLNTRLDSLTAVRWQNKYQETEYRKEAQEKLRQMDQDYNRALVEKNVLEERTLRLRQEIEQEQDFLSEKQQRYQALRQLGQDRLQAYKQSPLWARPVNLETRIQEQNALQAALEKQDIARAFSELLSQRLDRIQEASTQDLEAATVLGENTATYPALQLRLGHIHYSTVGKTNGKARLLIHTGVLKGNVYAWREDLDNQVQSNLQKAILAAAKKNDKARIMVPMDILQSKALAKGLAGKKAVYIHQKAWEFLKQGGPVMVPLGLIALLALLMVIERIIYYRRKHVNSHRLMQELNGHLLEGDMQTVLAKCRASTHTSLGKSLCAIMDKAAKKESRANAEHALQEAMLDELPALEKRLSTISVFGSTAPLLGLLGTVAGMISLFEVITNYGTSDPKLLAGGISEALITTETGLIIAIPIILMHNYLSNRMNHIIGEINRIGLTVLNQIWPAK